jgi:hypothetical protein
VSFVEEDDVWHVGLNKLKVKELLLAKSGQPLDVGNDDG